MPPRTRFHNLPAPAINRTLAFLANRDAASFARASKIVHAVESGRAASLRRVGLMRSTLQHQLQQAFDDVKMVMVQRRRHGRRAFRPENQSPMIAELRGRGWRVANREHAGVGDLDEDGRPDTVGMTLERTIGYTDPADNTPYELTVHWTSMVRSGFHIWWNRAGRARGHDEDEDDAALWVNVTVERGPDQARYAHVWRLTTFYNDRALRNEALRAPFGRVLPVIEKTIGFRLDDGV